MAITQIVLTNAGMEDDFYFTPGDRWDGYALPSANTSMVTDLNSFQGYCLNWNGFNHIPVNSNNNLQYSGYTTNFAGFAVDGTLNSAVNSPYVGYTTNWGQYGQPVTKSINDVDKDSVIDHPKDETIYYKLKGWNANTQQYESWIISHNITGRPSLDGQLFDPIPGREPPNVERDVFKTPPSGNTLSNIIIVARWIE